MLRQDRALLWLPAIGTLAGLAGAAIVAAPGLAITTGGFTSKPSPVAGAVVGAIVLFFATLIGIYFQAALVIGANQRADGHVPTLTGVLHETWQRRKQVLGWGLTASTVGVVIRTVDRRVGGLLGGAIGLLAGIAWGIATFLALPVVIAEGLSPIAAVKRSAYLIRQTWGTSLRTTLRWGASQVALIVLPLIVVFAGVVVLGIGSVPAIAVGVALMGAGLLGVLAIAVVFAAISTYAQTIIYRYAVGAPVPGIDPYLFVGVFVTKQRRWRRG